MSTNSTGVVPIWWPVAPLVIHEVFHPGKPYQSPQDVFLGYDDPRNFASTDPSFQGNSWVDQSYRIWDRWESLTLHNGTEISTTFWEGCSKLFQFQVFF